MPKVATTQDVRKLNQIAVQKGFDRTLDDSFVDSLDPNGVHICIAALRHDEPSGPQVVRSMFLFKITNDDDPDEGALDLEQQTYGQLRQVGMMGTPEIPRNIWSSLPELQAFAQQYAGQTTIR